VTDDARRDELVADALQGIAVPPYAPGFWDRLDARLAAEGFPGLDVPSLDEPADADAAPAEPALPVLTVPEAGPDPVLVPAAAAASVEVAAPEPVDLAERRSAGPAIRRSARRRSLAALGVAAAAVVAVLALQLTDPERGTIETASGGPQATLRTPGGGSTVPGAAAQGTDREDGGSAPGDGVTQEAEDDGRPPTGDTTGSAPAVGSTAATLADAGTPAASVALGRPGAQDTPQDAFVTWASAIDAGDTATVVALTGPRTTRYYEALGTTVADASSEWGEAYGVWAEGDGRRIDALEAGRSAGARVVVLLLERPAADAADGVAYDAVPVVQAAKGWVVEPAALDPEEGGRIELVSPAPATQERATTMRRSAAVEVVAASAGTYTLALDRATTTSIAAADAVEGTIRWDPPDKAMTAGRHVLVVAHVSDGVVTALATTLDVV
jgi:hypothetical protein